MGAEHGSRVLGERQLDHFAGMDTGAVYCPAKEFDVFDQAMPFIK
jgi:hypothetical protein